MAPGIRQTEIEFGKVAKKALIEDKAVKFYKTNNAGDEFDQEEEQKREEVLIE